MSKRESLNDYGLVKYNSSNLCIYMLSNSYRRMMRAGGANDMSRDQGIFVHFVLAREEGI